MVDVCAFGKSDSGIRREFLGGMIGVRSTREDFSREKLRSLFAARVSRNATRDSRSCHCRSGCHGWVSESEREFLGHNLGTRNSSEKFSRRKLLFVARASAPKTRDDVTRDRNLFSFSHRRAVCAMPALPVNTAGTVDWWSLFGDAVSSRTTSEVLAAVVASARRSLVRVL